MENISEIPMRWIIGDTLAHIDTGSRTFEKTYLIYLNDSEGELIIDNTTFPIIKNSAYIFNEGLSHSTKNTGTTPRLLLGPMNEFTESVGMTIGYYTNYADAFAMNSNSIAQQGGS